MAAHELKICPRCSRNFECKSGSITQCQCSQVQLEEAPRQYIETNYNDCLCIHCLQDIQKEMAAFANRNI